MSGINTGILTNAYPLSTAHIKELESQVLNNNKSFAYLDENSKLCFALPHGVSGIKDLAWNNAYELSNINGTLTKKAYKKTGLNTFALVKTFTKADINATWASNDVFEFDGNTAGLYEATAVTVDDEDQCISFFKVSDKFFSAEDLIGNTVVMTLWSESEGDSLDDLGTFERPMSDIITSDYISADELDDLKLVIVSGMPFLQSAGATANTSSQLISVNQDFYEDGILVLKKGTYFSVTLSKKFYGGLYVKSISCLTEADIVPALTNRLTHE